MPNSVKLDPSVKLMISEARRYPLEARIAALLFQSGYTCKNLKMVHGELSCYSQVIFIEVKRWMGKIESGDIIPNELVRLNKLANRISTKPIHHAT